MKHATTVPARTARKKSNVNIEAKAIKQKKASSSSKKEKETKQLNKQTFPAQKQSRQPGKETAMRPVPASQPIQPPGKKLEGKTVIITGSDSGIGKAVSLLFAANGANIVGVYLEEHEDAQKTEVEISGYGVQTLFISGDITHNEFCKEVVEKTMAKFGRIDILINNAAVQFPQEDPENISEEQLLKTFSTNVFAAFYFILAALAFMKEGSCIINTTSVTAYRGSKSLIDYSATKGALVALTRSLSTALIKRKIRVNGVAPGPIWTPLIPSSFPKDKVKQFGTDVPMGRAGQPQEVAPCYLFLASEEASYITGQIIHPNGGEIING